MMRNGNGQKFISAALVLAVASLVSRVVGLLRERVLTTAFGAGDTFDAFVAAFRLPDVVFNLIVVGALSASFIPLFTEKLVDNKNRKPAFDFSLSVFNLVLFLVAVLSIGFALTAHWLVPLITPGFTGQKLADTVMLSRIMALQPVVLAASFVFSGILNSFKRFVAYAIAPILYNVGIIIGAVYFVPFMGVAGLGWGVVLGALLHFLVQTPSILAVGWRWQPVLSLRSKDLKVLGRMMLPRMLGLAGQQVNLFLVTIIGSTLAAGSITAFHLANNIQSLPIGVFGLAFAQAAFPTMSEQVSQKKMDALRKTITKSFRYILFFIVPLSAFFFLLRAQIVRVLFGDGAFDWDDTILTYSTLGWLTVSLFAQATIPLLVRAFYVRQNTTIPVAISLLGIIVNVVLAFLLAPVMGVAGLALAFSIAAIVNLMLLLGVLHWQLNGFDDWEVLFSLAKIAVATLIGGIVLQALKVPVAAVVDMKTFGGVFTQLVATFAAGLAVYLLLCLLFKSEELSAIRKYIPQGKRFKLQRGVETTRFGLPD